MNHRILHIKLKKFRSSAFKKNKRTNIRCFSFHTFSSRRSMLLDVSRVPKTKQRTEQQWTGEIRERQRRIAQQQHRRKPFSQILATLDKYDQLTVVLKIYLTLNPLQFIDLTWKIRRGRNDYLHVNNNYWIRWMIGEVKRWNGKSLGLQIKLSINGEIEYRKNWKEWNPNLSKDRTQSLT